jgi:hypothetical protein
MSVFPALWPVGSTLHVPAPPHTLTLTLPKIPGRCHISTSLHIPLTLTIFVYALWGGGQCDISGSSGTRYSLRRFCVDGYELSGSVKKNCST